MGLLVAKIEDFDRVAYAILACAGVPALFFVGLTVTLLVRAIRKDNQPPTDP